ncbi:N-acetylmuramic acid 6-phosphate etherase [Allorhodopirellula solitaria]|nr:N-acetylmuramic acid 6-phosphate etherase [Allorhodopirellula solitaria]
MDPSHELTTEARNERSDHLDLMTAPEIVQLMNAEDATLAAAVAKESEAIAEAIDVVVNSFQSGGRLFYIGAGTSGRLGVLDASECPPTFNTPPEMVIGIIAGGDTALRQAIEGAEDSVTLAAEDLAKHNFNANDTLVGIASSGGTPYVIGGLDYARQTGAATVGLTCNANSRLHRHADTIIAPVVGPEILSGSTRLKAGTATKMVLNMLTTGAMVRIGKTYGNWMVDLRASNDKLRRRSIRIVGELTGLSADAAAGLLGRCDGDLKTAIVSHVRGVDAAEARERLQQSDGQLREALKA